MNQPTMHGRLYLVMILGPVIGYVAVLLLVAAFVAKPSPLGWIGFGVASAIGLLIGGLASVLYPRSRTNTVRSHPRVNGCFRLLVVADAHCKSASLCRVVRDTIDGRVADVLVVAPVLPSPLHFLAEDEQAEREDAGARLSEALLALTRLGIDARGVVGADDPLQAVGDALAGFDANEILFAVPAPRQRIWLEQDLERRVRDLFGVHVSILTVDAVAVPAAY